MEKLPSKRIKEVMGGWVKKETHMSETANFQ